VKTIADLAARQARPGPLRPQRPLDGDEHHRRRPHPRLGADDQGAGRGRRTVVVCAHLGRPRVSPETRSTPSPRGGAAGELLGRPWRSPPTPSGVGPGRVAAWPTARSCCWRTSASTPARPARTTPSGRARRLVELAAWPTPTSPTASASCTASRRRSTTSPRCCRTPRAAWSHRGRGAQAAHRGPRAAVRRRARRRQGRRQARGHRQPAARPTAAHRRRHGLHLPRRPGLRGRFLAARRRQIDTCKGTCRAGQGAGVEMVLPVDVVVGRRFAADGPRPTWWPPTRSRPTHDGPGHRSPSRRSCSPKLADAKTVFWNGPMGVFEMAPFAAGTRPSRRPGRRHRRRGASPWSAAATRPPPSGSWASPTTSSGTSPPVAVRAWSTSRARTSPASPSWRILTA
jgi:hypothetical protein